jgi:hypothetical protein
MPLSDRYKGRIAALGSTSTTRYKATLHNGASRPTAATTVYAATGLGELATVGTTYTTGGAGLTGGITLNATLTGYVLSFADKTITTGGAETVGPFDTVAIWDTTDSNGLLATIDLTGSPQTASNGGTITIDFAAATVTASVA